MKNLMYRGVKTWNPFIGCKHDCCYCYARQQAKRLKCPKCRAFEPHFHPERMNQKFKRGDTVFVCSMGDITFCSPLDFCYLFKKIESNPQVTFLLQSKNPKCFNEFLNWGKIQGRIARDYPENLILGTTIETNWDTGIISKAPAPWIRLLKLKQIFHYRKYITIEPIIDFDIEIIIEAIKDFHPYPEFIYIGYDNHNHYLNEPELAKTKELIAELKKITEVREKTLRKAWWER